MNLRLIKLDRGDFLEILRKVEKKNLEKTYKRDNGDNS